MASFRDPFDHPGGPGFIQSFPIAERTALAFFASVGIASVSVVTVSLALHANSALGRGVYSCLLLLGAALLAITALMLLPSRPPRLRRPPVAGTSLLATAAFVSAFSLAEMLALAFIRTATSDPLAGDPEKLTALFAASFILLGVLGLLSAAFRKTTKLPGAHAPVVLVVAALPILLLYSQSLAVIAVVGAFSLLATTVLLLGARIA